MKFGIGSVFAAVLLSSVVSTGSAYAAGEPDTRPTFRMCSGKQGGMYDAAANTLKKYAIQVNTTITNTTGSMANIDAIVNGTCDGGWVQRDALTVASQKNGAVISSMDVAGDLVTEYVHAVCNRSLGLSKVWQLTKDNTVAVGDAGGGTWVSWESFRIASPKTYKDIKLDPLNRSGVRALKAVESGELSCMIHVSALGAPLLTSSAQPLAGKIQLIRTDDSDLLAIKNNKGQPLYSLGALNGNTYKQLMPEGTIYGYKDVGALGIQSVLVVSSKWIDANERQYDNILNALTFTKIETEKTIAAQK